MAIKRMKTMYLVHLHLASSFPYLLVLPFLHKLHLFLYDTRLEFGAPTIVVSKYTNNECFPSSAYMFVQNAQERNSPYHLFAVIPWQHLLVVAFSQTIV